MLTKHGNVVQSVEINSVLRNTYLLLSMTLILAAVMAYVGTQVQFSGVGYIAVVVASLVALIAIHFVKNSSWAVVLAFVFTGLMGFSIGPALQATLAVANGALYVGMAAGITGLIFVGLSAYVLISRKDFSFMGGILFIALIALVIVSIVAMFVNVPLLDMAIAYAGVLLFSGLILFDTSRIVHGGQKNYVLATVELFLDIINVFLFVLRIAKD